MLKICKLGFLSIQFIYLRTYPLVTRKRQGALTTSCDRDRPKYVNPRVHPVLINFSLGIFKKKQNRPHL